MNSAAIAVREAAALVIRIRVIQTPTVRCIDGVQIEEFRVGACYEVGNLLGALFLAEGWAEPVDDDAANVIPLAEEFTIPRPKDSPPNLIRESFPFYYRGPASMAADRRTLSRKPRLSD